MQHHHASGFIRTVTFALTVASAALAGCASDPREGALGQATFAYRSSRGCADLFADGCAVGTGSLLVGVNESLEVRVSRSDDPRGDLILVSTAPQVVEVTGSSVSGTSSEQTYRFRVSARARGTARVELRRPDGAVVDHVTARADEAASIAVVNEATGSTTLSSDGARYSLRMGVEGSLTGFAQDAAGRRMFGNDAVIWTVPDTSIVELGFGFASGARIADDRVSVTPRAPGVVRATVTAGAVSRAVEITVSP